MAKSTKQLMKEALTILNAELPDVSASTRVFLASMVVIHVAVHVFEGFTRDATSEERARLKLDILEAYREYIAPIDLPGVPNYLEPFIDNAMESGIGAGLDVLLGKVLVIHAAIDHILKEEAK